MTVTSDFDPDIGIVIDAQRRISSFSDSLALINPFTQATDANKPRLSITGNEENLFSHSGDLSNVLWIKDAITATTAGTVSGYNAFKLTETAVTNTHILSVISPVGAASGMTCKVIVRVKADGRSFLRVSRGGGAVGVTYELSGAGAKLEATATGSIELQDDGYYLIKTTIPLIGVLTAYFELKTALTTGAESYAGDGTSGILCYEPQLQFSAGAENTPLTTTTHPIYAGINGRQVMVFNGTQALLSSSQLGSIVANNNKLVYIVMKPFELTTSTNIFRDTGPFMGVFGGTSGNIRFRNFDGETKEVPIEGALTSMIFRGRHFDGNIYAAIDTGSGFVESDPEASSNTTVMTDSLRIGNTSSGFFGQIAAIRTYNDGTLNAETTAYENSIRNKYLSGGGMSFNPLTGKLVYKGRSGISI